MLMFDVSFRNQVALHATKRANKSKHLNTKWRG